MPSPSLGSFRRQAGRVQEDNLRAIALAAIVLSILAACFIAAVFMGEWNEVRQELMATPTATPTPHVIFIRPEGECSYVLLNPLGGLVSGYAADCRKIPIPAGEVLVCVAGQCQEGGIPTTPSPSP